MGPVVLEAQGGLDRTLRTVRRRLRGVQDRLLEYGMLRWLGPDAGRGRLAALPRAEVAFNYLGQWDGLGREEGILRPSAHGTGGGRSPEERRWQLLEVNAMVVGGRLEAEWGYSGRRHHRETVARWAERWLELLRDLLTAGPATTRREG